MALVKCTSCGGGIPESLFRQSDRVSCPGCKKTIRARLLPALYKSAEARPPALPQTPPAPGEATCFYNPARRATTCCEHCGVYISDAWAARWGKQTVCLKCLEELQAKNGDTRFESKRILWDNIALAFSLGPWFAAGVLLMTLVLYPFAIMIIFLTVLTAPAAIFVALRYWNSPRSLVPRGRGRLVWATLLGVLQLAAWALLVVGIIYMVKNPGAFS
ncbi:MAG: hypothetical protein RL693_2775 [Verrucomicrobiota bacterium]